MVSLNLAGSGSLYLQQISGKPTSNESEASSSQSLSSVVANDPNEEQPHCSGLAIRDLKTQQLLDRADEALSKLRVS